ncbi:MAG: hypothetical protein VB084_01730 [Syntrophomonadaceae bacterium]|nr:hypothetical protein [Syntrophomonadaceae bacterium]
MASLLPLHQPGVILEQAVQGNTDYRLGNLLAELYINSGDKEKALELLKKSLGGQAVMYKSYANDDKGQAQIWALKYLLASGLSYKDGLALLEEYALDSNFPVKSEDESTSKDIVNGIVRDQAFAESMLKSYPDWLQMTSAVYLDAKNNIAYQGYAEKANNWKPIIVRYHSPAIYGKDDISGILDNVKRNFSGSPYRWQQYEVSNKFILAPSNKPTGRNNWAYPIIIESNIPFEEHLQRAGYPIENITFIDM